MEFLPGCLTEHPVHVHHPVCFGVGICVRSYTLDAVLLAEIFLGCCDSLLNGRETVRNIHVYHNDSKHLPSGLTCTSPM